jgi:protein-glutamine gamma-glutamyltransferase
VSAGTIAVPRASASRPRERSRRSPSFPLLSLATFSALSAFAALHWVTLVVDPPLGRALATVAIATGGAVALAALRAVGRWPLRFALAAVLTVTIAVATLLAAGIPAAMLEPANWDVLRANLDNGLAGITGDVEFPYSGRNEWSRLAVMFGLAAALTLAAALAFWPRRDAGAAPRPRLTALVVLVCLYAVAVIADVRGGELLRGLGLCALIAAWLWLPSLGRGGLLAGSAVVAIAAALAIPAATRLDAAEPWFDYEEWSWAGGDESVAFNWDHEYGPIDWPRDGTALFEVISDKPHYWRTAVLDSFDGVRWLRSEHTVEESLEVPTEVEAANGVAQANSLEDRWVEQIGFRISGLRTDLLVGAGAIQGVEGLEEVLQGPDGSMLTGDALDEGSAYAIEAYVPEPGQRQLRAAGGAYPPDLARYTAIDVPARPRLGRDSDGTHATVHVQFPLRGERGLQFRTARDEILASPYAETYRLARRLTAGAPSAFAAVRAIESRLKGRYTYSEAVPNRDHPLPAFLFEHRIGYCQHFSGAMALMLRMSGIPARVASGFSPGAPIREEQNRYRVEDYDAHSWVEVWFNGIGWVALDPTPAAAPANLQSSGPYRAGLNATLGGGAGRGRVAAHDVDRRRPEPPPSDEGGGPDLSFFPPLVGILGVVGFGTFGWRALRYRRLPADAAAEAQIGELSVALGRLGWDTGGGTTLRQLHERFILFGKSGASRYVSKLAARRYESRSRGTPTLSERRALRRELARGGLRSRLAALRAIPPGGPAPPPRS